MSVPLEAQEANYDESLIPQFALPDPLRTESGSLVTTVDQWRQQRRPEILSRFQQHVYGCSPDADPELSWRIQNAREATIVLPVDREHPDGDTVPVHLKELTLVPSHGKGGARDTESKPIEFHVLILAPVEAAAKSPVILGYNFKGNHTIDPTDSISMFPVWERDADGPAIPDESSRGSQMRQWPIGLLVSHGYALVTLHYGDVDPDFDDGFRNGVHTLFPELQGRPDNWSSIGAWSWGLQRVLDGLSEVPAIDTERVTIFGHSRLGKTALWCGATDPRIAAVISNNSGCGGAALSRRRIGETVKRINTSFPHWFCRRFRDYNDKEDDCPVDQHELVSLIAPRPVYIASATEDRWADPRGEFLSAFHAQPVYQLFGQAGLGMDAPEMPLPEHPVGQRIGYHLRTGKHDVVRYDWLQYLKFLDRELAR